MENMCRGKVARLPQMLITKLKIHRGKYYRYIIFKRCKSISRLKSQISLGSDYSFIICLGQLVSGVAGKRNAGKQADRLGLGLKPQGADGVLL